MLLIEIPDIRNDLDVLLANDDIFSCYDIHIEDVPWKSFNAGFPGLVCIIISQQISFKAALNLWEKLNNDFEGDITPQGMMSLSVEQLKAFGFSRQKQEYLNCLCQSILKGSFDLTTLDQQTNKEVLYKIQKLKGFGLWSAQIYLLFCLLRRDILPLKDLVIDKALKRIENLKMRPTPEWVEQYCQRWKGKQTAATLLLWYIEIYQPSLK